MSLFEDVFPISRRPRAIAANGAADLICAPVSGRVIGLSQVDDPAFSSGMLGEGTAIVPDGDVAYAPVSGTVAEVVGSKHALAIDADNGAQVLLHVGIDTVNLRGRGFRDFVGKGDRVGAGDALIWFDRELIRGSGLDDTVIVTVINARELEGVEPTRAGSVRAGEALLRLKAVR